MASRKEMERLEDENRTVCQRLADVEIELSRKEEALKTANQKYVKLEPFIPVYACILAPLKIKRPFEAYLCASHRQTTFVVNVFRRLRIIYVLCVKTVSKSYLYMYFFVT